jgi:hypothetical protein
MRGMRALPPRWSFCVFFLGAVALSLATPPVAVAAATTGDPAVVNKVTNLNKKALDAYAKQDYETARAVLKEALEVCASAGLDQHPITARTHIHFGIVAIAGYQQREVGIKQFRKALEIQPDIKLTKQLVTPDLQDAFEEAVLASGGSGAVAGGDGGGRAAQTSEDGDDDSGKRRPTVRRKKPKDDEEKDDDEDGQTGVFFVALTGGTGFGLVSGNGALDPTEHKLSSAGFALAQLGQVSPEVGLFVSKDLLISVSLRLQMVNGVNGKAVTNNNCGTDMFCSPSTTAAAGFAKVSYLLGSAPFHFTIGGQIGGGYIRHAVAFNDRTCKADAGSSMTQQCIDTLNGGPFLIGPTVGMMYELGDTFNLVLGLNTALGVPNFTFNVDVQGGIAVRL